MLARASRLSSSCNCSSVIAAWMSRARHFLRFGPVTIRRPCLKCSSQLVHLMSIHFPTSIFVVCKGNIPLQVGRLRRPQGVEHVCMFCVRIRARKTYTRVEKDGLRRSRSLYGDIAPTVVAIGAVL